MAKKKVAAPLPKPLVTYDGQFLDPENVNSSIRYSLETTFLKGGKTRFDGNCYLSDCNRFITWEGSNWNGGPSNFLAKLDKAIKTLKQCRDATVAHMVAADTYTAGKKGEISED